MSRLHWSSMSWFSQFISAFQWDPFWGIPAGSTSPWSPCHGCMNFQNSHRFDWHLLRKYPWVSAAWGATGSTQLLKHQFLERYFWAIAIFLAETKQFINFKQFIRRVFGGSFPLLTIRTMETSWSGHQTMDHPDGRMLSDTKSYEVQPQQLGIFHMNANRFLL